MDTCAKPYISLCSGVGGLDIGLRLAAPLSRCVLYVEREVYACAVLAARMQTTLLDEAPIWSDLFTLDCQRWRGKVSGVIAGFPCPPVSTAGKRLGTSDPRWLWPEVERCIRESWASWCFLENVPGLLSANNGLAFGSILRDLAALGFNAEWCVLSAAECGASQQRKRVFLLAWRTGERVGTIPARPRHERTGAADADRSSANVGDSQYGPQRYGGPGEACYTSEDIRRWLQRPAESGGVLADAEGGRGPSGDVCGGGGTQLAEAELRGGPVGNAGSSGREGRDDGRLEWQGRPFPPGPGDAAWGDIIAHCPHFAPAIEPGFRFLVDGSAIVVDQYRVDQLRALGNGVVPICAAVAFVELALRAWGTK